MSRKMILRARCSSQKHTTMATKKDIRRTKIKFRIRHKVSGTSEMPRLSVFRSNKEIYAQVIDDVKGVTLTAASSREKSFEKSGFFVGETYSSLTAEYNPSASVKLAGSTRI